MGVVSTQSAFLSTDLAKRDDRLHNCQGCRVQLLALRCRNTGLQLIMCVQYVSAVCGDFVDQSHNLHRANASRQERSEKARKKMLKV